MLMIAALLPMLLIHSTLVMESVRASCRLFVYSVMPGLFPYLTLTLMMTSRLHKAPPAWLLMLLGWCGGSPTGARLLAQYPERPRPQMRRIAATCATMSPMFLVGTTATWLGSRLAGVCILTAVLLGGWLAGLAASVLHGHDAPPILHATANVQPLRFGQAVEAAARTMLLVCGTMAMLRAAADLCAHYLPNAPLLCLTLRTMLEVTCGVEIIAGLPLPLAWRTALIAGATGFGGMAVLMQNRAVLPEGTLSLPQQIVLQLLHGGCSFLLALGIALLICP